MDSSSQLESIFFSALEKHNAEERAAFLDEACAGNEALRRRIERMLEAQAGNFLCVPALEADATSYPTLAEGPGTQIGPYKLLQQIGEGGFGVVFMAEQTQPVHRKVALKIVKPGMDSRQVIARFEAERQALALMDHPNIAKVFDAGATEDVQRRQASGVRNETASLTPDTCSLTPSAGRPYFVMELVQGVPITEYCDQCNLTTHERLELFISVCHAVQHAHQKGVIHRDIKPTNVLASMQDGRAAPKIIDFGVAKAINQRLTEHTLATGFVQMIGTPMYMSPEQAELSPLGVDTRTDIYSLGVLLYELLTGTTPFEKERLQAVPFDELRRIIREEEPPRPSARISTLAAQLASTVAEHRRTEPRRLVQSFRGELDWIVMKCLEKDRNRRYETASALAADVQRYLNDERVEAYPPSAMYRFGKFARRNKRVLSAAIALVLGLVTTTVLVWREQTRTKAALDDAEASYQRAQAVVDRMVTRAAEELADRPHMEQLRRELLEEALAFYQEFLRDRGSDPRVRYEAAKAYTRVGSIYLFLEQGDRAEKAFRQAAPIYESLLSSEPSRPDYRRSLTENYFQLGTLLRKVDRHQEALAIMRQVVAHREKLVADVGDIDDRLELAGSYIACGVFLNETGQPNDEEEAYRRSLNILTELSSHASALPKHRELLAHNYFQVGAFFWARRRTDEAEDAYRKALELREGLVAEFPTSPAHRRFLAGSHNYLGFVLADAGRLQEAETAHRRAIDILAKLTSDFPSVRTFPRELALSHNWLGERLTAMNRPTEADAAYQEAAALLQELADRDPDDREVRWEFALSERRSADRLVSRSETDKAEHAYRKAVDVFEHLASEFPTESLRSRREAAITRQWLAGVLQTTNRPVEAEQTYRQAAQILQKLTGDDPDDPTNRWELALCQRRLAHLLIVTGSFDEARETIEKVLAQLDQVPVSFPDPDQHRTELAHTREQLAWLLVRVPNLARHDAVRAVRMARQTLDTLPKSGNTWRTLGVAHYRIGEWAAAVEALEKSRDLPGDGDQFNLLFLAMAHWQLGDKEQARKWYDQAINWMEKHHPQDEQLVRFRAEAERLLQKQESRVEEQQSEIGKTTDR